MKNGEIKITPVKIPFRYPWDNDVDADMRMKFGVNGLNISRIVDADASAPTIELMDRNTPRPDHPRVACVVYRKERIDDFRFLETTTWLPLA